jgi:glucan 1,3-beta-glucosidase
LLGFASGTALAWQARQMIYACRSVLEWCVSIAACVCALGTAIVLARAIAAALAGIIATADTRPRIGWRFGWLFALAWFDLLLIFDGRYRDFPLGLFALPCLGYALAGWMHAQGDTLPLLEERLLAAALPWLATIVLAMEHGLNATVWLWLGLNLGLAAPVLQRWFEVRRLPANQPQAAQQ